MKLWIEWEIELGDTLKICIRMSITIHKSHLPFFTTIQWVLNEPIKSITIIITEKQLLHSVHKTIKNKTFIQLDRWYGIHNLYVLLYQSDIKIK